MLKRHFVRTIVVFLISVLLAWAEQWPGEQCREQWQRVDEVIAALGVNSGSQVADVGAGNGFFTVRFARAVGDTGRVFAVDVSPVALRELGRRVETEGFKNVEIIQGEEDDPRLPEAALDAAIIVNAYHEMAEHRAMLAGIWRALKAGGRLLLLEPGAASPDATRAQQARRHQLALALAEADVREAGYEVVRSDPAFATMPAHRHQGESESPPPYWLLVARKAN
jgi:ubiquinone/menaquinone biosynthesis C-methylase UbiE